MTSSAGNTAFWPLRQLPDAAGCLHGVVFQIYRESQLVVTSRPEEALRGPHRQTASVSQMGRGWPGACSLSLSPTSLPRSLG